jgi:hypothetical protein
VGDDEDKKEIVVKAPSKSVISPERKTATATEKALEEERYNVLQISSRAGKYAGFAAALVGISLFVFLGASVISGQGFVFLSASSSPFAIGFWILVGLVTIVVGFLLLGSD